MENKSESLEKKLDKPDWKQWLPIYGIYQNAKDAFQGKPNMVVDHESAIPQPTKNSVLIGSAAYHAIAGIGTAYGLYQLAEKLF